MTRRRRRSRGSPLGGHRPSAAGAGAVLAVVFARTGALPIEPVDLANGQVYVSRAGDGDTIVVQAGGGEYRIRYIGIDTPETVAPGQPVEHFGKEAWERNKALVEREGGDAREGRERDRPLRPADCATSTWTALW